jgi:hypothetical protein
MNLKKASGMGIMLLRRRRFQTASRWIYVKRAARIARAIKHQEEQIVFS